jgi:DNA-binding NtrC family response regulator
MTAPQILGGSPAMAGVLADIHSAARTHAKVLITGETGVGKDVVARLIHTGSPRAEQAFVAVNCSGIPETLLTSELFGHARGSFTGAERDRAGLIRQADGGTLFLDELGEMSLAMQAALLRFTETGEVRAVGAEGAAATVDVRLITATNKDLRAEMASGSFRQDLYYRLNVVAIHVPPLRERRDDVLLLFRHFLEQVCDAGRIAVPPVTREAEQALRGHHWPGNVRELRNVAERVALSGSSRAVAPTDLGLDMGLPVPSIESGMPATSPPLVSATVDRLWDDLVGGSSFWTLVYAPFKSHEITRPELSALIDRGLRRTRGSYRALVRLFNMPADDYKRFHAFLYQQRCNLPVARYREG